MKIARVVDHMKKKLVSVLSRLFIRAGYFSCDICYYLDEKIQSDCLSYPFWFLGNKLLGVGIKINNKFNLNKENE